MHKAELDRKLIQFLMGLKKVYTIVRGSILMMNPLPTMAQIFFIIIQEEKQREVKPHNKFNLDSTFFHVNVTSTTTNFKTNYAPYRNNGGNSRTPNRSNLFYDYCKKTGHIKEKCYNLHGFPPDFKFTKGKNAGIAATVNGFSEELLEDTYDINHEVGKRKGKMHEKSLTQQQIHQVVNLLEHIQIPEGSNTAKESGKNLSGGAVNFAVPFTEEPSGDW
ncbi:hypothetical protein AABB24_031230 [Solanum stoloniferum]|uniref:Uncharacterized protein n=1 Tax=Solanum stoloniferum TaxID=62892 RepID=A0ABD2RT39_9SOLN